MMIALSAQRVLADVATWRPSAGGVVPEAGFVVATENRAEVLHFYNAAYLASTGSAARMGWTGSFGVAGASQGVTSAAFQGDVRRRVNFYRALAGVAADVTFDEQGISLANAGPSPGIPATTTKLVTTMRAAFMNSVQFSLFAAQGTLLSHTPPSNYAYYNLNAWHGCRHSNLAVGHFGPEAMDVYMADNDIGDELANNVNVGHRRWILFPRAADMSTGDVPPGSYVDSAGNSFYCQGANALYVLGPQKPAGAAQFVAWPNPGWCPAPLMPTRWSLSYAGADFTNATVTVTGPAGAVPVNVIHRNGFGVGDTTIVFIPTLPAGVALAQTPYTTTVSGIAGVGVPAEYTWTSRGLDVNSTGVVSVLSAPTAVPAVGGTLTTQAVEAADSYALTADRVGVEAVYRQGAEDTEATDVIDKTTATAWPLRQVEERAASGTLFRPRSGAKSFHLSFPPGDAQQSFELKDEFLVAAEASFEYQNCFRWLFIENKLALEVTTNGGATWQEIDSRNGAYSFVKGTTYNASLWDKNPDLTPFWRTRTVSLAAFAGQVVRFRFTLTAHGNGFDGKETRQGCYIDDIAISGVQKLASVSTILHAEPTILLNTAQQLVVGVPHLLRVAPVIGGRRMPWSPAIAITPTEASGYQAWAGLRYPDIKGGLAGDSDGDGVANGLEYVLGTDPVAGSQTAPAPQITTVRDAAGLRLVVRIPVAANLSGVRVDGQVSHDLVTWRDVPVVIADGVCTIETPTDTGSGCGYVRIKVSAP